MGEQTHLSAMVCFVGKHVAQHFRTHRPGGSPIVAVKVLDAASILAESFGEHFRATGGAFG
jgi:hypothetical protein